MKKYRIKSEIKKAGAILADGSVWFNAVVYHVQMSGRFGWVTIKSFVDEDEEYAYLCALDLLLKLRESI